MSGPRVVEKFYSPQELSWLLGFAPQFWRDLAKNGELTLHEGTTEAVIAEPLLIAGELRIPASSVNAYLARHPFRYDPGTKARNKAELRRRLGGRGLAAGVPAAVNGDHGEAVTA